MKLYQLLARGPSRTFDEESKLFSQRIFKTKKEAENYKSEFEKKVVGDGIYDLTHVTEFKIIELELLDE